MDGVTTVVLKAVETLAILNSLAVDARNFHKLEK